ncbi:peroxidase-like [Anticarsia gemmatalis]|uniref:peroxidase-like n=1 Tax=Anticarsia gemmatalis TaxID=129554 RepID=UPI003F76AF8A
MIQFVIFISILGCLNAVVYDTYTELPATKWQKRLYAERNNTYYCAIDIKPCDPEEWRRVDGSCNNLKSPSTGAFRTPPLRWLPRNFSFEYDPRNAKSGEPLPLPRYIRTELLQTGKAHDIKITQLVSYYTLFILSNVNSLQDSLNYGGNTTTCCQPQGRSNYICAPNKIPVDDPVHRYSGVRCQNLTKPLSFQYFGCADFGNTTWSRIVLTTAFFDLATIYYHQDNSINKIRAFKNGLLKIDTKTFEETGMTFPPGNHTEAYNKWICVLNELPKETLCYHSNPNSILGTILILVLFYRQHNYIADELLKMNPCWDDDQLFYTAKDINIAVSSQIYLYELLPVLFGRKRMIRDGLITCSGGFRDLYDDTVPPKMSDEFVYINRWFHTIQDTTVKLFDKDGYFLKTYPMVNMTGRSGYLARDDNLDKVLRGSYRQVSGRFCDYTVDYDMADNALSGYQFASDVTMNDLAKGRYFGMAPYIKYREFCSGKKYTKFSDLEDVMTKERIHRLKQVYTDLIDLELMAGTWLEKPIPGGRVAHTLYCIFVKQLRYSLTSDRHWYERPNRPHAFTAKQLQAIRKVSIAGVLCRHANVYKIQPRAFYAISDKNPLVDCNSPKIAKLDLSSWKDPKCKNTKQNQ